MSGGDDQRVDGVGDRAGECLEVTPGGRVQRRHVKCGSWVEERRPDDLVPGPGEGLSTSLAGSGHPQLGHSESGDSDALRVLGLAQRVEGHVGSCSGLIRYQ